MYCRLCDIEYPKSLRFCKWCGGGLVDRDALGPQHCPGCGSSVDREWLFCNECGVDLATLGAQPKDVPCPACSAVVRKGWMFCRQCGEQIATERPSLRCGSCGAGVRVGWLYCKQCGKTVGPTPAESREHFATLHGIPALPPERGDLPFSGLSSGELPPLDNMIKRAQREAAARAKQQEDPQGGTVPLKTGRHTGQLDKKPFDSGPMHARPAASDNRTVVAGVPYPAQSVSTPPPPPVTPPPQVDLERTLDVDDVPRAESPTVFIPSFTPPVPGAVPPPSQSQQEQATVVIQSPVTPQDSYGGGVPYQGGYGQNEQTIAVSTQLPPPRAETASYGQMPPPAPPVPPQGSWGASPTGAPPPGYGSQNLMPGTGMGGDPNVPGSTVALPGQFGAPQPSYPPPQPSYPPPHQSYPPSQPSYPPVQQGYPSGQQMDTVPTQPEFASNSFAPMPGVAPVQPAPAPFPQPAVAQVEQTGGSGKKWMVAAVGAVLLLAVFGAGAFALWKYVINPAPAPPVVTNPPAETPPVETPPVETPKGPVAPEGMVLVAGATFKLGTDDPAEDAFSKPAHDVTLKPFFIDKTEVTNGDYKKFVDETKRPAPPDWADGSPAPGSEQKPVVNITWDDASAYARWAGKRLPTEMEWELAARGTDGRKYAWGSDWDVSRANVGSDTGEIKPVGGFPSGASPCGALDMIGNVWEWTSSEIAAYPGGTAADFEKFKGMKVFRGGAFDAKAKTTAMYRGFDAANKPFPKIGFRCAKDAQ